MPPEAFLMTGSAVPFRPAAACPVTGGPHHGGGGDGSWMVADAATADGTAAVRIALWRCAACGVLLIGVGRPDADPDAGPGSGIHAQEFTWLEDARAPVLLGGGNGSGPAWLASGRQPGREPGGG